MKISGPLENEAEYRAALQEIESLMNAEEGTVEAERLAFLVTLVKAYERDGEFK
jgi:HTH-type transcriptional regulator / antitoxin HigA